MKDLFKSNNKLKNDFPNIFDIFEKFFSEKDNIAIGLSWWSDSMLLAHLVLSFREEKKWNNSNVNLLHCNHRIRKESEEEKEFLKKYFSNKNLIIFERDTSKYPNENEESLRERRYSEFSTFCKKNNIKYLCLWHNLTDRIETSFMNMIRWCGIKWFKNMNLEDTNQYFENTKILRPLLYEDKESIEKYCEDNDIPFFQDKTNFDTTVSIRNNIRHNYIFPLNKLSKKSSFYESRKNIYSELDETRNQNNRLIPMKLNPYRNASHAYERVIPKGEINWNNLVTVFTSLWISPKKEEISSIIKRLKNSEDWFFEIQSQTIFLSHERIYFIKGKQRFREKELNLEKEITYVWIQRFWNYQLDIPQELIWTKIRFPKKWDYYKWKLFTKRALNKKIPIFRRNSLPLAEKDEKIIVVFEPQHIIFN